LLQPSCSRALRRLHRPIRTRPTSYLGGLDLGLPAMQRDLRGIAVVPTVWRREEPQPERGPPPQGAVVDVHLKVEALPTLHKWRWRVEQI